MVVLASGRHRLVPARDDGLPAGGAHRLARGRGGGGGGGGFVLGLVSVAGRLGIWESRLREAAPLFCFSVTRKRKRRVVSRNLEPQTPSLVAER